MTRFTIAVQPHPLAAPKITSTHGLFVVEVEAGSKNVNGSKIVNGFREEDPFGAGDKMDTKFKYGLYGWKVFSTEQSKKLCSTSGFVVTRKSCISFIRCISCNIGP